MAADWESSSGWCNGKLSAEWIGWNEEGTIIYNQRRSKVPGEMSKKLEDLMFMTSKRLLFILSKKILSDTNTVLH